MNQRNLYLLLCVVGAVAPWIFLSGFLAGPQFSFPAFFLLAFANDVASALTTDLVISAVAAFVFMFIEGRRLGMTRLWIYVAATLCVGLSFGLPLFLYFRSKAMSRR